MEPKTYSDAEIAEAMRKAGEHFVAHPETHVKGTFGKNAEGKGMMLEAVCANDSDAVAWCTSSRVLKELGYEGGGADSLAIMEVMTRALSADVSYGPMGSVCLWNNRPEQTGTTIGEGLIAAAAALQQQQQQAN